MSKKVSKLENDQRGFVTLSDHCARFIFLFSVERTFYIQFLPTLLSKVSFIKFSSAKKFEKQERWPSGKRTFYVVRMYLKTFLYLNTYLYRLLQTNHQICTICSKFVLLLCFYVFLSHYGRFFISHSIMSWNLDSKKISPQKWNMGFGSYFHAVSPTNL